MHGAGIDVSHRGGKPGFVRVDDGVGGTVLTFPDFRGNFFFNTLGNITAHPKAGLLFVDHETGGVLQLTGARRSGRRGAEGRGVRRRAAFLVRLDGSGRRVDAARAAAALVGAATRAPPGGPPL